MGQMSDRQRAELLLGSLLVIEQDATSYDNERERDAFHRGAQTALNVVLASLRAILEQENKGEEEH